MTIKSDDILAQLERLAEACPWEEVDIWANRTPEGRVHFTAYARGSDKYGLRPLWGHNKAIPAEAVDEVIKQNTQRDPEISRQRAIRELQEKIEKLKAVVIGLPPYKPGRILGNGDGAVEAPATVDV